MDKKRVKKLLSCIADSAVEKLPDIIKKIPAVGGVLSESFKAVLEGVHKFQEEQKASPEKPPEDTEKQIEKIKEDCFKAMLDEAKNAEKPKYMSCVIFPCKFGILLSEEQQEKLDDIFNCEDYGQDQDLNVVVDFVSTYTGGDIYQGEDYEIGDNYFSFNFFMEWLDDDEEGYPYDEEPMKALAKALNSLLGQEIFKDYIIFGE